MIRSLFTVRWISTTLIVVLGVLFLIRLGFWQLERLEQRRAFNARVFAQIDRPVLDLNHDNFDPADLINMEYRKIVVSGEYDHDQEVLLRNQVWQNYPGYHILTPLKLNTKEAILVDRGWIPLDAAGRLSQFRELGTQVVRGWIRRPQSKPDFGGVPDPTLSPGETRLDAWNIVNLERIQQQVSFSLLPVYVQQMPDPDWQRLPYRSQPVLQLSEGSHLGYALQFFSFAALLALGYPFFVWRQLGNRS